MRSVVRSLLAIAVAATAGLVLAPVAAAQAEVDYVALGDSYASGTGTRSYYPDSGDCLRSPAAYPVLWTESHATSSFFFDACSGATTDDLLANQLGNLGDQTDLVTVSIGGNDAGFAEVMTSCSVGNCAGPIAEAQAYIANELPGRLAATYGAIAGAAPNADVVVLGYPQLFELGGCLNTISEGNRDLLNRVADQLAGVTAASARAAGFLFADTRSAFTGHRVCAADEWINGPSWPIGESYHPDVDGHAKAFLPTLVGVTG